MCNTAIAVTSEETLAIGNWACHQLSTHTTISRRTMLRHSLRNSSAPWFAIDNRDGLVRPACTSLRLFARMTAMVLSPLRTAACGKAVRHIPSHAQQASLEKLVCQRGYSFCANALRMRSNVMRDRLLTRRTAQNCMRSFATPWRTADKIIW